MKTLTPEQRIEGFSKLEDENGRAHLASFLAGIGHAEKVLGEVKQDYEPVATLDHNGNFKLLRMVGVTFGQPINLYERPAPRRPFARLSEDEIESLANSGLSPNWTDEFELYHFARAIEDALEKKNK